ncbi:ParA family partition ATPase [Commensalibacter nepenthis]|uniref:ParA family partition ATPase n=1 Tax=Commensalibacter nepenthis TaxID=3043872 RepID=A0ABT6QA67_9PROT|nr:ParA family partition ATPase [Commensalibacter sp. TBRC 10068]MDI2113799.1 ParA family partition ATPase [Commensalibacter sp. TBRC 10068]
MKTIAILSQKGGAGKTTIALNLSVAASLKKKTSVIIDIDPQASITQWGDSRKKENPTVISVQASRLSNTLTKCLDNKVDFVFIDTAPHAEQSALLAARQADLVIIPCRPSVIDIRAIQSTIDICKIAEVKYFIVLNQVLSRSNLTQDALDALKELKIPTVPVNIGQRIAFINSVTHGEGVMEFDPNGKSFQEINNLYKFVIKQLKS